jgi:hypothetical protein
VAGVRHAAARPAAAGDPRVWPIAWDDVGYPIPGR